MKVAVLAALLAACGKGSGKKPCDELKSHVCASGGCEGLDEYLSENGALPDEDQQVQCKMFLEDPETLEAMKAITSMGARVAKTQAAPVKRYALFARFRDAAGLPNGTKVVVRGLPVGEVTGREADGKLSRIAFEVDGSVLVKRGAKLTRRQSSTLGENMLELEPGEGEPLGPSCAGYDDKDRGVADRCREVTQVIEATVPQG